MKERSTSRGQGREGDRASEGRLCENHEPMDKNLIEGRSDLVSWHNTAKPFVSVREVNEVVVWWRTALLPGEWERSGHSLPQAARRASAARQICRERSGQKSAEAIVVEESSRGLEDARINNETGGLTR